MRSRILRMIQGGFGGRPWVMSRSGDSTSGDLICATARRGTCWENWAGRVGKGFEGDCLVRSRICGSRSVCSMWLSSAQAPRRFRQRAVSFRSVLSGCVEKRDTMAEPNVPPQRPRSQMASVRSCRLSVRSTTRVRASTGLIRSISRICLRRGTSQATPSLSDASSSRLARILMVRTPRRPSRYCFPSR
jgi:hypothetical protein